MHAIEVDGIGKRYRLGAGVGGYGRLSESVSTFARRSVGRISRKSPSPGHRYHWALRDVSFEVGEGEILGIVGRNGAGKTTLLKVLSRITDPTEGRASLRGRVGSLLEVGTGFHPELTGRENVFLNGAILGMSRREIRARYDDIIEFAELEEFVDTPVKRYSSGMFVRLAFSVAAYLEPEILFVDEVLSVGDQAFQQRCFGRMGEIAHSGRTILFVSHNLASVAALCNRGLLLDDGRVVVDADVDTVIEHYLAGIQAQTGDTLSHREDRQGDGSVKFESIEVAGPNGGPVRTGAECTVRLAFVESPDDRDVYIGVSVEGPLGEPVFLCSNRITGDTLRTPGGAGTISLDLPRIPLLPGRYSVNVYAEVSGVLADWVRSATFFDVVEADVFGTGRLPPTTHGSVVVDHSWEIEGT